LAYVQRQMQIEKTAWQKRRQEQVARWTQAEELKLTAKQDKMYNAIVIKLEDRRQDKKRVYLKEQKRLKQKYRNTIAKM
jgi:hypothetical protein